MQIKITKNHVKGDNQSRCCGKVGMKFSGPIRESAFKEETPMKQCTLYNVIFILLLTVISGCKSTITNKPLPPPTEKDFHADQKCYHNGKLTDSERRSIYPFDKAVSMEVISFDSKLGRAPIDQDTIVHAKTREAVVLSTNEINRLSDILYNYNYSKETNFFSETTVGCYYPRHAIVFLDKSEKVISYIELCLECSQVKTSLPKESTGQFCEGKYDLLRAYFVSIGIRYFGD